MYRSLTSLSKYIPKYFIGFNAIVKGIIFSVSFPDVSLLVYRNAIDLNVLIFCL